MRCLRTWGVCKERVTRSKPRATSLLVVAIKPRQGDCLGSWTMIRCGRADRP